ncbi:hypothetical protein LCGC14_0290270 [marine sediment metagenome]
MEIRTDDDALSLLERLLNSEDAQVPEVSFVNWPKFELHVKGERYHSTITPELMSSFLSFQKNLNKSYALIRYADSSRRLRDHERDQLKILVEVGEGSSGFLAKLEDHVEKMSDALVEGIKDMDPRTKMITILSIGLMVVGGYSVNNYLDQKKEIRLAEIALLEREAERQERLDTLETMQRADDQRMLAMGQMFEKVVEQMPQLYTASQHMASAYDDFIASTKDADSIEMQGVNVPGRVVNELSNSPRNKSVEDRVSGVYRILNVDHSNDLEYRFKLFDVTRGQEIIALLPRDGAMITDHILDLLQEAEWGKRVVALHLITKTRSGKVVRAEIEKVARVADQEKYAERIAAAD